MSGRKMPTWGSWESEAGESEQAQKQACRVSVKLLGLKDIGAYSAPVVQLQVEDAFVRIAEMAKGDGGEYTINQSHSFDVKEEQTAELTVAVGGKTSMGMRKLVGAIKPIKVSQLLSQNMTELEPEWVDLYKEDKKKEAKVLILAVAAHAPTMQNISVFIGSWNVGNKPPPEDLSPWLPTDATHNLIAIGSQECEYPPRSGYSSCADDWTGTIRGHFGSKYRLVKASSRGQMRIVVLVLEEDQRAVVDVEATSEATGIGHVIANKGAVCISLKFWDTPLCFINSHLAAHEGMCKVRNENYTEVVTNMRPGITSVDLLNQFHHLFWFGDLNYRIDMGGGAAARPAAASHDEDDDSDDDSSHANVGCSGSGSGSSHAISGSGRKLGPTESHEDIYVRVLEQVNQKDYWALLDKDELKREIRENRAFFKFQEAEITFAPTFKVIRHKEQAYNHKRLPAWCDRVLWRSLPGCKLASTGYDSAPGILTGDHKPVYATFKLDTFALPVASTGEAPSNGGHSDMRWHVHIKELAGVNLLAADANGLSDPYIKFLGPNLTKSVLTKKKTKTLNPVWTEEDIPPIMLQHKSLARVEKDYLMLALYDYDFSNLDDPIGFAAIPLAEGAILARMNAFLGESDFTVDVTHKGLPAGKLKGSLQIKWEENTQPEAKCAQM